MHPRALHLLVPLTVALLAGSAAAGNVERTPAGSRVRLKPEAKEKMSHRQRARLYRSARKDLVKAEAFRRKAMGEEPSKNAGYEANMAQAYRYRAAVKVQRAQGRDGEATRLEGFASQAARDARTASADPLDAGGTALFRHEAGSWGKQPGSRVKYGELDVSGSGIGWKATWTKRDRFARGSARPSDKKSWPSQIRNRPLPWYRAAFGADAFDEALAELGPGKTWLDAGAGQGRALANYLASNQKLGFSRKGTATVIAVDLDGEPETFARQFHPAGKDGLRPGDYRVVKGDIARVRIDRPVDLLTDYFGPLTFNSHTPDVVLRRYGKLVPPGGRVMLVIPARGWNTVLSPDGRRSMDLMDLIRQTSGFRAERPIPLADPQGGGQAQSIVLVRTADPVVVPRLEMVKNVDKDASNWDAPRTPERIFRITRGVRSVRFPEQ